MILYTQEGCGHCLGIKAMLKTKKISYEEHSIEEVLDEIKGKGIENAPVLRKDDGTLIGSRELIDFVKSL